MRLSVAMCTYNGAQYLQEQLASLAAQTRLPDELVVCDDCSSDGTRALLEEFKARAAFPVRLSFNERNLRSLKNFEQAIRLCEGDIIALCDQDDVWLPEKLERTEAEFAKGPGVGLVFTDLEVVDRDLRPLGYRAWQTGHADFGRKEQRLCRQGRALDVLVTRNPVTGAAMAFRSTFKEMLIPFPDKYDFFIHDWWIALLIAAVADLAPISEPLVKYRIHPGQQLGLIIPSTANSKRRERARKRELYSVKGCLIELVMERLLSLPHNGLAGNALCQLQARSRHLRAREMLAQQKLSRRAVSVALELLSLRYHRYTPPDTNPWYEAASDLLPYRMRSLNARMFKRDD